MKTWVTLALDEDQAVQALVLGQTFRNLQSRWKTVVLTKGSFTGQLRFKQFICLTENSFRINLIRRSSEIGQ